MSELEQDYADEFTFTIVTPEVTQSSGDVQKYALGTHGLVAFDAQGAVVATIPGHEFGRDEILAVMQRLRGDS